MTDLVTLTQIRSGVNNERDRNIALPNTIVVSTVGSTVHGLGIDGNDDLDLMGVCVEPREHVIGLSPFENWVYRTKPDGVRSEVGDVDLTIYSLRKYARLASGGNPTVLLLLFSPEDSLIMNSYLGNRLRNNYHLFVSKKATNAFHKYMRNQREALVGERGGYRANRPELIEKYGYDVKYAYHMIRLGFEGLEISKEGKLTLPMPEVYRNICMGIRRGEYSLEQVLLMADELGAELEPYLTNSILPDEPDYTRINNFLLEAYEYHWYSQYVPKTVPESMPIFFGTDVKGVTF